MTRSRSWVGPKTLILIQLPERVETNAIVKIIKFSFQRLFMGVKIHTFSEIGSQNIFRGVKINQIYVRLEEETGLQGPPPRKVCQGYKRPQVPFREKKKKKKKRKKKRSSLVLLSTRFSSLPNIKNTQMHKKKHQSLLIPLSSPKTQDIVLIPNLFLLGSTSWIWGLGVWM